MPDTTSYTNVSTHPQPLASGRILAPGETADLDLEHAHDNALHQDGVLAATETRTDYTGMRHDQLAALAAGLDLDVKGTGKDGNVTNADFAKALTANDKKENR